MIIRITFSPDTSYSYPRTYGNLLGIWNAALELDILQVDQFSEPISTHSSSSGKLEKHN